MIQEPSRDVTNLKISGRIEDQKVEILLDTGSAHNYISEQLAERIVNCKRRDTSKTAIMPDGRSLQIKEKAKFSCKIEGLKITKFKIDGKILKDSSEILILGTNFMIQNRAIINYDLGTISLDNIRFEIPETALGSKSPESLLTNNFNYIFNVESKWEQNQSFMTEFKNQLVKFDRESSELGQILNEKQKIDLTTISLFTSNLSRYLSIYDTRSQMN